MVLSVARDRPRHGSPNKPQRAGPAANTSMPICASVHESLHQTRGGSMSMASFGRDIRYSAKRAATWLTINRLC